MANHNTTGFYRQKRRFIGGILVIAYLFLCTSYAYAEPPVEEIPPVASNAVVDEIQVFNIENGTYRFEVIDAHYYGYLSDGAIVDMRLTQGGYQGIHILQESSSFSALLRDTSGLPSIFTGLFEVNSNLVFINTSGIYFSPTADVRAEGLIASSLSMASRDFLEGNYRFMQDSSQSSAFVLNEGSMAIGAGGLALLGGAAANRGVIEARGGNVVIAGGRETTLSFDPLGLVGVVVNGAVIEKVLDLQGNVVKEGAANTGKIIAEGQKIKLTAEALTGVFEKLVNNTGVIEARSLVNRGGSIELISNDSEGIVSASGTLDVSGGQLARGGDIRILGDRVHLMSAAVDASGGAGGGEVMIGGNYQGRGSEKNARQSYMDETSSIHVDALYSGDGGRIIVWSDEDSRILGSIAARGGSEGGNGGFAETSSAGFLYIDKPVDLSAVAGAGGEWLLDPLNIDITTSNNNLTTIPGDPTQYVPSGTSSRVLATTLNTALNAGTSVTVKTTGTVGAQAGDIRVLSAISKTSGTDATLSILAAGDITVQNTITATGSGKLHVLLSAVDDTSIQQVINTNGGNFTSTGDQFTTTAAGPITTAGGNFSVNHVNTIAMSAGVNTGAGNISLATTDANITLNAANAIVTTSGNVNIDAHGATRTATLGGTIVTADGDVTALSQNALTVSNSIVSASGDILLRANGNVLLSGANADITTAGMFTAQADFDSNAAGTYSQNNVGSIINVDGDIAISGLSASLTGTTVSNLGDLFVTSSNGNIALGASGALTTTSGEIHIDTHGATANATLSGITTTGTGDILIDSENSVTISNLVTSTSGNVAVKANRDVALNNANSDISTSGDLTIQADNNSDGAGNFNQSVAGSAINVGGDVLIRANDVTVTGTISNVGSDTMLLVSDGGTIGLGSTAGNYTLSGAELLRITTDNLTIGDNSNSGITVNNITAAQSNGISGLLTLNATSASGSVAFATTNSTFNALEVNAGNGVTLTRSLFTDTGGLTINADSDANGTGTFSIATGQTLNSSNQSIAVRSNDMILTGTGSINSGSASTTLTVSDGGSISLGSGAADFNLQIAELANITAGTLKIGDATAGSIAITSALNLAGTNTLSLETQGTITQSVGATITEMNLALRAGGAITLNENNNLTQLSASSVGGSIHYRDANELNIGSVDALTGVTALGQSVVLITGTNLILNQSVDAGTGNVSLTSLAGALVDGNAAANNISAQGILLSASQGIGTLADPLGINFNGTTPTLTATNSAAADIAINGVATQIVDIPSVLTVDPGQVQITINGIDPFLPPAVIPTAGIDVNVVEELNSVTNIADQSAQQNAQSAATAPEEVSMSDETQDATNLPGIEFVAPQPPQVLLSTGLTGSPQIQDAPRFRSANLPQAVGL